MVWELAFSEAKLPTAHGLDLRSVNILEPLPTASLRMRRLRPKIEHHSRLIGKAFTRIRLQVWVHFSRQLVTNESREHTPLLSQSEGCILYSPRISAVRTEKD